MYGKNLKYFRLKQGFTMKELAAKIGVTNMAISNYENDKRTPDMEILRKLADALNIRVMDFMISRNERLSFVHGEFSKSASLAKSKQEYICESVEEYFNRFFTVVEILGSVIMPKPPVVHHLELSNNYEKCAVSLRQWLNLSTEGPVYNLIATLENHGILVYLIDFDNTSFAGMNGMVNGCPYIVLNSKLKSEKQRFTIAHELVHMAFDWKGIQEESECEAIANRIAGAFLFPKQDVQRELGIKRNGIKADMLVAADEFGISIISLAHRAKETNVITEDAYRKFMACASKNGWKKDEPSRLERENTNLFKLLVYRAIAEEEINVQRGAELLKVPYGTVDRDLNQLNNGEV